ncbi:MAG: hypothetical protein KDI03_22380, partial [Anaerolineae bacterium]|nr:hypothetical protein [Anaerolineae bacterium]
LPVCPLGQAVRTIAAMIRIAASVNKRKGFIDLLLLWGKTDWAERMEAKPWSTHSTKVIRANLGARYCM